MPGRNGREGIFRGRSVGPHQSPGRPEILKRADQTGGRSAPSPLAADASGYASAQYAASFTDFGEPFELPACGGWLLRRRIPLSDEHDAIGCYPLFACANWRGLAHDLVALEDRLVSVTLVTDPFGAYSEDRLRHCFPDLCMKYKDHYTVDIDRVSMSSIGSHHRRNVRRGLREVQTEFCADPTRHLGDWRRLYSHLIERHNVKGIAAFSDDAFRRQIDVPGLVIQRAVRDGETVGMVLWILNGGVVYYHLGAYSTRGYRLRASFALFWNALEHFRGRAEFAALGAAAGARPGEKSGLDRFKAGWATATRPAFLCGRILAPERYAVLARQRRTPIKSYFPAYRAGEFE